MFTSKDITALEAWNLLTSKENCALIDVRTEKELLSTGSPKLENRMYHIPSHEGPSMSANPFFIDELISKFPDKNIHLIFICRTNARSNISKEIATNLGYENCYIVIDGYLGNELGAGWVNSKLPYEMLKKI